MRILITIFILLILIENCSKNENSKEKKIIPKPVIKIEESKNIYKKVKINNGKLRIREQPKINSNIIASLENEETVIFIEEAPHPIEIDGKKGKWTKIKHSDKMGWVFGAYLKNMLKASINTTKPSCYEIDNIFAKKFGIIGKRRILKVDLTKDETSKFEESYNNGIELNYVGNYGARVFNITFKNHSLREVYELLSECDSRLTNDLFLPENNELHIEFSSCDQPCSEYDESFNLKLENNRIKLFFFGTT